MIAHKILENLNICNGDINEKIYCLRSDDVKSIIIKEIDKYYPEESYDKKYSFITNKVKPRGFEIHHIDSDRENNSISNLVLLPRKLHREYHKRKNAVLRISELSKHFDGSICDTKLFNNCGSDVDPYNTVEIYKSFYEIKQICCDWVYLRDCIIGLDVSIFKESISYKEFCNMSLKKLNKQF